MALIIGVSAPLFLSACSDAASSQSPEEPTGTISAAISTVGADGATYSFPVGARVLVEGAGFGEYFDLSGQGTTLNVDLPVGTYDLHLFYDSGLVQLERTLNGNTTLIDAQWLDPAPVAFAIDADTTTPVALHFSVEALGDITFDSGELQVSLDVNAGVGIEAGELDESGSFVFSDSQFLDASAAYASELSVELGVPYAEGLDIQSTGAWQFLASNTICKSGELLGTESDETPGFARRLQQLSGSGSLVQVCVYDYGTTDLITFSTSRSGEPPEDQTGFLTGTNYQFVLYMGAYLDDVFDGKTLKQSTLAGVKVDSGFFSHYVYENGALIVNASGSYSGTLEFGP